MITLYSIQSGVAVRRVATIAEAWQAICENPDLFYYQ